MSESDLHVRKRRMLWAISSEPLLDLPESVPFCRNGSHIRSMTERIQSATTFPELNPKLRMGKYFEQLVQDCLQLDPTRRLILANHTVLEEKITVGEIDLIIEDLEKDEFQHWEIALKYYLQTHEGASHELMIGPNAIDNLDRKLRKLHEKQLPLSEHPSVKEKLSDLGIKQVERKLFLKGQFFYHSGETNTYPANVHPDHEHGWWVFQHEASEFLNDKLKWCFCWKPDWVGPNQFSSDQALYTKNEILSQMEREFKTSNRSLLLIGCIEIGGIWNEKTRGFVVNDNWPHLMLEKA